ncbi:MAG TPA: glyoxalase [Candidatus Scatomonas merdigallinarum]|nr:glyoxalase [Candidatus Scatomonas merdigallinarum]
MNEYSEACVMTFLREQSRLFDEPVAENYEEAEAFLEDSMAAVVDSLKEVRDYLEESGMDVSGLSDEELEEEGEVFPLPNGQYLIVEA